MFNSTEKRNSIWYTSFFIISSVLNFVNFSLCFKTLNFEIFGLFIFITSIYLVGNSLDFGFGLSTIKHIAHSKVEGDYEFINSYFVTYFILYTILGIIISLAFVGYYFLFLKNSDLIKNSADINSFFIYLFLAVNFFLNYLTGYLRCVMEGISDYVNLSKISIAVSILNTALVLIMYINNYDVYYLTAITIAVSFASFITTLVYLRSRYSFINFTLKKIDFNLVKRHYKYGIKIHVSMFIGSFSDPIIKYLIGTHLSLSYITFYESSKKIINFTNGLIISAQRSLFVKLSESNAKGTLALTVNNELYNYSKMSNYYSILIYGILNPFLCMFVMIWFKNYESVIILLLYFMSYSLINFGGSMYNAVMVEGKGLGLVIIQVINIVSIYIFLMVSLIIFNSYLGLIGFYFATVISIILLFYFLKLDYQLNYRLYLKKIKFRDIILLNILLMIQTALMYKFEKHMYLILILFFIVNVSVYRKYCIFFYRKLQSELLKLYRLRF